MQVVKESSLLEKHMCIEVVVPDPDPDPDPTKMDHKDL